MMAGDRDTIDLEGLLRLVNELELEASLEELAFQLNNLDVTNHSAIDFDIFAKVLILLYDDKDD